MTIFYQTTNEAFSIGMLTVRFMIYPFIIYTLISLAITLDAWKDKRVVALHVSVSLIFLILWSVNIAKLLGYVSYVPLINDYVFTPVLIVVAVLSWRRVFIEERSKRVKICKKKGKSNA